MIKQIGVTFLILLLVVSIGLPQQMIEREVGGKLDIEKQVITVQADPKTVYCVFYPPEWNEWVDQQYQSVFGSVATQQTFERKIQLAKFTGIDVAVWSWWGIGHNTDTEFQMLLSAAAVQNYQACIYLEIWAGDHPQSPETIEGWIDYIIRSYGSNPHYAKIDGQPVIFIWVSGTIPDSVWERILPSKRATFIGMGTDINELSIFDGLHDYTIGGWAKDELRGIEDQETYIKTLGSIIPRRYKSLQMSADFYNARNSTNKHLFLSVIPGYDRNDDPFKLLRWDGATYQVYWDAVIEAGARNVLIVTGDEVRERTGIFPVSAWGLNYIWQTKENITKWKAD